MANMITDNNDILYQLKMEENTQPIITTRPKTYKRTKQTTNKRTNKRTKQTTNKRTNNYITSEVIDDESYNHFKSLIANSPHLCKGKEHSGKRYKVNISLRQDYETLKQNQHYRTIYVHDNSKIIAYIGTKIYKKDGGFIFIHKLCSNIGTGEGTRLMKMILEDAKRNHIKLGITYVSLTTHNLDLIDYYNKFSPTKTIEVDSPGSTRKIPRRVAYMIWQVSPNMPNLHYS